MKNLQRIVLVSPRRLEMEQTLLLSLALIRIHRREDRARPLSKVH